MPMLIAIILVCQFHSSSILHQFFLAYKIKLYFYSQENSRETSFLPISRHGSEQNKFQGQNNNSNYFQLCSYVQIVLQTVDKMLEEGSALENESVSIPRAVSAFHQAFEGQPGLDQIPFSDLENTCQKMAGPEGEIKTSLLSQAASKTKVELSSNYFLIEIQWV